ncbi:hypothetical protein ACP4OV_003072 [Aristida adscensionis]
MAMVTDAADLFGRLLVVRAAFLDTGLVPCPGSSAAVTSLRVQGSLVVLCSHLTGDVGPPRPAHWACIDARAVAPPLHGAGAAELCWPLDRLRHPPQEWRAGVPGGFVSLPGDMKAAVLHRAEEPRGRPRRRPVEVKAMYDESAAAWDEACRPLFDVGSGRGIGEAQAQQPCMDTPAPSWKGRYLQGMFGDLEACLDFGDSAAAMNDPATDVMAMTFGFCPNCGTVQELLTLGWMIGTITMGLE